MKTILALLSAVALVFAVATISEEPSGLIASGEWSGNGVISVVPA